MKRSCLGFTLVETLMALGVVSGGLLILMGLLSSTIQGAGEHELRRTANEAVNAVLSHLEQYDNGQVLARHLIEEDELPELAAWDTRKLFVDRGGELAATSEEIRSRGYERFEQAHFFEVVLVNDTVFGRRAGTSRVEPLIFAIRLSWPATLQDGAPTPAHQRSRLTVSACLLR